MDKELLQFLDWLYQRRSEWFTVNDLVLSGFAIVPHDLTWMLQNDVINHVRGEDGVDRYRISVGGRMKRAAFHRARRVENLTLVLSFSALLVSIIALFVTVCLP